MVDGLSMITTAPISCLRRWHLRRSIANRRHRSLSPLRISISRIISPRSIPQVRPIKRIPRREPIEIGLVIHLRLRNLHPFTAMIVSCVAPAKIGPSLTATARICRSFCRGIVMALILLTLIGLCRHRRINIMLMILRRPPPTPLPILQVLTVDVFPFGVPQTLRDKLLPVPLPLLQPFTINTRPLIIPHPLRNTLPLTIAIARDMIIQGMRGLQSMRWMERPWHRNRRGRTFGKLGHCGD